MYANMLDQFRLCVGRPGDENRTGVCNRFGDGVKIVVIRGRVPASDRVCLVMDMPGRMIRVQNEPFYICCAEMEHPRFTVIDPDHRVIVMLVHGSSFLTIDRTSGTVERANAKDDIPGSVRLQEAVAFLGVQKLWPLHLMQVETGIANLPISASHSSRPNRK